MKNKKVITFRYFVPYIVRFLVLGVILSFITIITYYFSQGMEKSLVALLNGLTISSAFGLFLTLFAFLHLNGYLNFFVYGFSSFTSLFSKNSERKYKDLNTYNELKKVERHGKTHYYLGYLFATLIFIIILIIVYFVSQY